jgi:phosphoribosylaminoimidazole carboxylase (NCAIR synthetase)
MKIGVLGGGQLGRMLGMAAIAVGDRAGVLGAGGLGLRPVDRPAPLRTL